MRFIPAVAVFILTFTPLLATAEPIGWTYEASIIAQSGQDSIYTGSQTVPSENGGSITWYGFVNHPDALSGSGFGSMMGVRLAGLSKSAYRYTAEPPGPDALNASYLRFKITDTASGETGTADLFLSASLLSS